MLKKTIKHNDLDGNPVETDAYFNLTKAECIELNIRNDLEVVGRSRNQNEIMDVFKRIIGMSFGVRTVNGEFIKEGFPAFSASEAYSELFMEIWQNPEYAQEFIRGIMPAGVIELAEGQQETQSDIPEHLRNHPSMQSNLKKREAPREGQKPSLDNFNSTPAVQPPAISESATVDKDEYQRFLEYKAARGVQVPPQFGDTPDELI